MLHPADRKVDVYFETRLSPLFDQHKSYIQESYGIGDRIGRAFASALLWIKSHIGSETKKASRIVKLLESEEKISLFERLQWRRVQGDTTIYSRVEAGDPFYREGCSKFIQEALSFMDLDDSNRELYEKGIQDMIDLANSLQESDVATKAKNANRVFCAHNRLRTAEDNKYLSSSNVEAFEGDIKQDMLYFAATIKQLRIDVRHYKTLKGNFEKPALGTKIAEDAKSLVGAYEKLLANPAFTNNGWLMFF